MQSSIHWMLEKLNRLPSRSRSLHELFFCWRHPPPQESEQGTAVHRGSSKQRVVSLDLIGTWKLLWLCAIFGVKHLTRSPDKRRLTLNLPCQRSLETCLETAWVKIQGRFNPSALPILPRSLRTTSVPRPKAPLTPFAAMALTQRWKCWLSSPWSHVLQPPLRCPPCWIRHVWLSIGNLPGSHL